MDFPSNYVEAKKTQKRTAQPTPWQEYGSRAAERMGEPHRAAAYIKIYKRHWVVQDKLEDCLRWIEGKQAEHKGKMFMALHKRFIQPFKKQ